MRWQRSISSYQSTCGVRGLKVWRLLVSPFCSSCHSRCSLGFPAPDTAAYSFLAQRGTQEEALLRAHAFLTSLFMEMNTVIRELFDQGTTSEDLPGAFRRLL